MSFIGECNLLSGAIVAAEAEDGGDSLLAYEQGGRGRRMTEGAPVRVPWRARAATFRAEVAGEAGP
jgi:hypothetical protein